MQERVEARQAGRLARRRRRRTRSARRVATVAAVVALAAGYVLGRQSERTAAEVARERSQVRLEAEGSDLRRLLGGQADRVIQQMWLTELAETQLQQP